MVYEITILITLFLLAVPALLINKFKKDKRLGRPFWQFGDYHVIVMSVIWMFIVIAGMNFLQPFPDLTNPDDAIDYGQRRKNLRYAQWGYEKKMIDEPTNLLHHYNAIKTECQNYKDLQPIAYFNFFDGQVDLKEWYDKLTASPEKDLQDAGFFGLACFHKLRDHSANKVLKNLEQVSNKNKPCVQLLYALLEKDGHNTIEFYKQEIKNNGNIKEATELLADMYYSVTGDNISLLQLYLDKKTSVFLPNYYKQYLAFRNHHYGDVLFYEFQRVFKSYNLTGILAAVLIFITWFYYIRRIDLYERERKKHVFLICFLGCLFTFFTGYVYHFTHDILNFENSGDLLNHLAYNLAGIGVVEEVIKFIPFFILLRFTKAVNEPMDYIIFPALSALSFAFIENILYFREDSMYNIHARAIWCVILHIFCSSIIGYTLMLAKYGWKKNQFVWFWPALCMAAIVHGLYDFFLDERFAELWIIPFLILLSSILLFTSMVNNCLNNSPFYAEGKNINTNKLGAIMSSALLGIIIFEYICMAFIYGIETGNAALVSALLSSWYLLMFLALRLTNLDIMPGQWERLQFFAGLNPFVFMMNRKINFSKYVGKEIIFNGGRKNAAILEYMPLNGKILSRQVVSGYAGWFLIELDKPLVTKKKTHSFVLMRTREENIELERNMNLEAGLFLIPDDKLLKEEEKSERDFIFLDWVLIN